MDNKVPPTRKNTGDKLDSPRGVRLASREMFRPDEDYAASTLQLLARLVERPAHKMTPEQGHNLNCLEIIVRQGELTAKQNWKIYSRTALVESEDNGEYRGFMAAVHLLDSIRKFLELERILFVDAIADKEESEAVVKRINGRAQYVEDQLDELVMIHVDEPDGSFTRGIVRLLEGFDDLITIMHETLTKMTRGELKVVDGRYLDALVRRS